MGIYILYEHLFITLLTDALNSLRIAYLICDEQLYGYIEFSENKTLHGF